MGAPLEKRTDRFIETQIDDEMVLMDLGTGDFFSLSGTALAIWQMVDGTRGREGIVAGLAAEYGADPAEIAQDFDAFAAELAGLGFLAEG